MAYSAGLHVIIYHGFESLSLRAETAPFWCGFLSLDDIQAPGDTDVEIAHAE